MCAVTRTIAGFVVAAGGLAAAQAADLSPVYKAPAAPAAAYTWTGCYLGGSVGYGQARASATTTVAGVSSSGSEHLNGVLGGGQAGCNYQTGSIVWGLEGDFQGTGQSRTSSATAAGITVSTTDSIPWFGTVRGRVGWAADKWLFFATGGWGYGEFQSKSTFTGLIAGKLSSTTDRSLWAAGGGVENALNQSWSWKIEYLHLDTGKFTTTASILGIPVVTSAHATDDLVRGGVNYHF